MKIALIGASGFVGTAVLKEAIDRGHQVTAIVRHPEKIVLKSDDLKVEKGDVMKIQELVTQISGNDIVISAYNSGWTNPNIYDDFIDGSESIQTAVKNSDVKRLLVVGGAGSLFIAPGVQLIDTPEFPEAYKPGASAAKDYLDEIKNEKQLDWSYISPAIEMGPQTSGERTGSYRLGTDAPVFNAENRSYISVEDLAVAILDEAENEQHLRRRFTVGY